MICQKVKNVKIMGVKYTICFINDENCRYLGLTNNDTKYIVINEFGNNRMAETILHELLHAYFYECGLFKYSNDEILIHWLDNILDKIITQSNSILTDINKLVELNKNNKSLSNIITI